MVAPRFSAECVNLNTSSGSAKPVNELPRFEIVWPLQNFQKSRLSPPPFMPQA